MRSKDLFRSFFLGGFECSTHRGAGGRRHDQVAATRHDRFAYEDYARARDRGLLTVRDGIRWHLIEEEPGRLDFASARPMVRAARRAGVQVMWDLMHYGWPDDLDVFAPEFVGRFARMARGFARVLAEEGDEAPWIAPINEISFLAWVGGEVGKINPFTLERGFELKKQLVRAAIAAMDATREVLPAARFAQIDPSFHTIAHPDRPHEAELAEGYRGFMFQAWDMLCGRICPELGGGPHYLDLIGVNYYPWNQWIYNGLTEEGTTIGPDHPGYRPFRLILGEIADRYGRPIFLAETGTEAPSRASWLREVSREVYFAIVEGVDVAGICLYPIVNFPGWDDGRLCQNGLWDHADESGHRPIAPVFADELRRQVRRFDWLRAFRA